MMQARAAAEESPQTSATYEIILEQAHRMGGILRQVLDFARIRAPAKHGEELPPIVRAVMAMLQPLAKRRDITLLDPEGSSPPVEVDVGQLQQVLTNLVINAIQASPRGGTVRCTVETSQLIAPGETQQRRFASVSILDRGEGIAADQLPRVFEPFFTTKDVGEGTGLGLSIAYGIVREHGGFISARSTVGEGSAFTIHLPLEEVRGA
jgi:signal transduction histidine kinase